MNYTVKKHSKLDFYPTYSKWVEGHNFPLVSDLILPENVFVVYNGEVPIYCIWVYFTDSRLSWVAFPASNKNVNYKQKIGGMEFLLKEVTKYCKRKKILMMITTSNTESINEALLKADFVVGDKGVNHFYKTL